MFRFSVVENQSPVYIKKASFNDQFIDYQTGQCCESSQAQTDEVINYWYQLVEKFSLNSTNRGRFDWLDFIKTDSNRRV